MPKYNTPLRIPLPHHTIPHHTRSCPPSYFTVYTTPPHAQRRRCRRSTLSYPMIPREWPRLLRSDENQREREREIGRQPRTSNINKREPSTTMVYLHLPRRAGSPLCSHLRNSLLPPLLIEPREMIYPQHYNYSSSSSHLLYCLQALKCMTPTTPVIRFRVNAET